MRSIAEALRETLAALGISRGVERAAALRAWPAVARDILGSEGGRTRALRVDGETLVVAVASPILAQELRLRAAEVVARLNRSVPESRVRAVRCVPLS